MRTILLAALCVAGYGQSFKPSINVVNPIVAYKPDWNRWHWSALALASAAAVDIHSSRDLYELNPLLGRGPFGARQAAVKVSITAGLIGAEYLVIRRWPRTERAWRWVNWIGAGATTAIAASNYRK